MIATRAGIISSAMSSCLSSQPSPPAECSPTGIRSRRIEPPAASVARLSPGELSAQDRLTSELLRTLSRMAASKPTSWLSARSHILSHSACRSGPYLAIWVVALSTTKLIPRRLTPALLRPGIRSLVGVGNPVRSRAHPVLYHPGACARLALKRFRGEPAISKFD